MINRYSFLILIFAAGPLFSGGQSARIADLQPQLRQALAHDDACMAPSQGDISNQALQSLVETEEIRMGGHDEGVIAAPHDGCDCRNGNCSTFVYLKSGDGYKLALEEHFASLHPMKIVKHGLPSLSGKFQVNPVQEETTVFDWSGKEYEPSLCATVTQRKNIRLPSIARHPCRESVKRD
ncbi:MAG TPA: hypothetical protein VFP59_02145 [Candidatus Angelobacter sp.]|nr:hypothetical protein [Candidatus Angelobacter sp.]